MRYSQIPVFTPYDVSILLKYFAGVDELLSKRFLLGFRPAEEHLTSVLCELLDSKGASLHGLSYTVEDMNKDLEQGKSLIRTRIVLETTEYNKYQERHLTQSDLGIVVNYTDNINRNASFKKGVLIQSKKLFSDSQQKYDLDCKYESFNHEQHDRLVNLLNRLHVTEPEFPPNFADHALCVYNR